jgi:hypothetical protein
VEDVEHYACDYLRRSGLWQGEGEVSIHDHFSTSTVPSMDGPFQSLCGVMPRKALQRSTSHSFLSLSILRGIHSTLSASGSQCYVPLVLRQARASEAAAWGGGREGGSSGHTRGGSG